MSKLNEPTPNPRAAGVVIRLLVTTLCSLPNTGRRLSHVRDSAQQQEHRLRLPGDCQGIAKVM
jgi:hypothetical protein